MKHLTPYAAFARAQKAQSVNEGATKTGETWTVMANIQLKPALLSAFRRKAKDEHGKDLGEQWSDAALAEWMVNYVNATYMNIESVPTGPIIGIETAPVVGAAPAAPLPAQAQAAVTAQPMVQPVQPVQADPAQMQAQADLPAASIQMQ